MQNEDELLETVNVKSNGWSRPNRILSAQEYFIHCNSKIISKEPVKINGYNGMNKVVVGEDNISFLNGHKFKFKLLAGSNLAFNEYNCYYLFIVQEGSNDERLFLMNYPLDLGSLKEIEITHFVKPKLNRLDFLRKSFQTYKNVGDELIQLLIEKAKYELSKVYVDFVIDATQVKDIMQYDIEKGLTVKDAITKYNIDTAKDYSIWLKKVMDSSIFSINYDDSLINIQKVKRLEYLIKSFSKFRREVKYLKDIVEESK